MSAAFLTCLAFTLLPANDGQPLHTTPGDPGGATCQGITLATFRDYCGNPTLTPADLGRITPAQVQAIYATKFWNSVRGDDLPLPVSLMNFDHGVTAGPITAGLCLQRALGLSGADVDGWIGPETVALVGKVAPIKLVAAITTQQEAYYRSLRTFAEFGRGWLARVTRRQAAAMALIGTATTPPSSLGVAQPPHMVSTAASGVAQPIYATSAHAPMTAPGAVSAHTAAPVQTHVPLSAAPLHPAPKDPADALDDLYNKGT